MIRALVLLLVCSIKVDGFSLGHSKRVKATRVFLWDRDRIVETIGKGVGGGCAASCLATLNSAKESQGIASWDSETEFLNYRPTSLAQLDSALGVPSGKALGVSGDDSMEDLKNALAFVVLVSSGLALTASQLVGGNLGPTLVWILSLVPIAFLGVGSTNPELISSGIDSTRIALDRDYVQRRVTHEAGHFLAG